MNNSLQRYELAQSDSFQARILVLALERAHLILNGEFPMGEEEGARMAAKAAEIINSPKEFKEKLALSVVAMYSTISNQTTEEDLKITVADIFDGFAGIQRSKNG